MIFNATVVETGERLMFSTVDFERGPDARRIGEMRTFRALYTKEGLDVSPVTAARLSATFPYVSPAARADFELPRRRRYHFVDGGYYDNLGVASAMDFLEQAVLRHAPGHVRRLMVIQIRDRALPAGALPAGGSRGWLFQTIAPLLALKTVRDTGQLSHDATEMRLLQGATCTGGVVQVQTVDFEYPVSEAPMSWYLDKKQKASISLKWDQRYSGSAEVCAVRLFLGIKEEGKCNRGIASKVSSPVVCGQPQASSFARPSSVLQARSRQPI